MAAQSLPAYARAGGGPRIMVAAERSIKSAVFSPDGRRLASTAEANPYGVALWDVETGRALWLLDHAGYDFYGGSFSPDGRRILVRRAANFGRTMKFELLDAENGAVLSRFEGVSKEGARLSPDGREIVTGDQDGRLELWDGRTGLRLRTLTDSGAPVEAAAFSPDGGRVLCRRRGGSIEVWDPAGSPLNGFQNGKGGAPVAFSSRGAESRVYSPDRRRMLTGVVEAHRSAIHYWDVRKGKPLPLEGPGERVRSLRISPDGRRMWAAWTCGVEQSGYGFWNLTTGKLVRSGCGDGGEVPAFLRRGRKALSVRDGKLALIDVDAGKVVKAFDGGEVSGAKGFRHGSGGPAFALSPDFRKAAAGGPDGVVRLWSVRSGRLLKELRGHAAGVRAVAFSPDGRRIFSYGADNTARVWSARSGRQLRARRGIDMGVTAFEFSLDGRQAFAVAGNKAMKMPDARARRRAGRRRAYTEGRGELKTWLLKTSLAEKGGASGRYERAPGRVSRAALSPGRRRKAVVGPDGALRIWSTRARKLLVTFVLGRKGEWLAITPEGFFSGSPGGTRLARIAIGQRTFLLEPLRGRLYRPDLIARILSKGRDRRYRAAARRLDLGGLLRSHGKVTENQ
jgi:WD40 repeat protein